jgi:hypothetical protein
MPTRSIELPVSNTRKMTIGYIDGKKLYIEFMMEPHARRPGSFSEFKIAYTEETSFSDSESVVFEDQEASQIASDIATALIYIAEEQLPPYSNQPVNGHPEIRVEQLDSRDVKIVNRETEITIPRILIQELGMRLQNR